MQDDYSGSVMVALLPMVSEWTKVRIPHLTLVYAGEIKDLKPTVFNELAKDACSIAQMSAPITLPVLGLELFGDATDVKVLTVRPTPELWAMRRMVERWNVSQHPFNPHVTVGDRQAVINEIPSYIAFDRVMVGWGDDLITFNLKGR
jgi:2'-5' RNA ligase